MTSIRLGVTRGRAPGVRTAAHEQDIGVLVVRPTSTPRVLSRFVIDIAHCATPRAGRRCDGLVPALDDPTHPRDVFLLVANDNDFITQHGFHAGQAYADASGADLDTMILVYRITLPSPPK